MMSNHSYPPDKCTFELLSAYLDGEVTAQQRQEVEELLSNNPEVQQLYRRLLYLRQEINNLSTPEPECSAQELSQMVFARIDEENKQRQLWLWGGGALVALFVASVTGIFNQPRNLIPQFAQENSTPSSQESLIIALNEPVIELPVRSNEDALMIPLDHSLMEVIGGNQK